MILPQRISQLHHEHSRNSRGQGGPHDNPALLHLVAFQRWQLFPRNNPYIGVGRLYCRSGHEGAFDYNGFGQNGAFFGIVHVEAVP